MELTRLAMLRRWATTAIFLALAVAGVAAYIGLPINQFPNVAIPVVAVTTIYPGSNPQEIETQITRRIEDAVAGLSNIDKLVSTSGAGFSSVVVQFTDKADIKQIGSDVERQVSAIAGNLPTGANRPVVLKINLDDQAVMQIALVDPTLSPEALYRVAHDQIQPAIEGFNGVSSVTLVGGTDRQVQVAVDPIRLKSYGVSLAQVQGALAAANTSLPGGSVTQGTQQFDIQISGLYPTPQSLGDITVTGTAGQQVRIRDLASVRQAATEQTKITRVNGRQAILLAIGQRSGANLTDVTDAIRRALPALRATLAPSSELVVVADTTPFVRNALDGIQLELISAVLLTGIILLLFLHRWRAAGIVLLSIPTTLLTTFVAMQFLGFSLNFLSMLGLTLTIGILVDDSIVVLENILRHLARGERSFDAALMGRAEIGLAAVAITLVDVVVFAPTGLVSGQIGGFFREFGFTIAAATLISLAVSFALTPMLAALLLHPNDENEVPGPLARFGRWWDGWFGAMEVSYGRLLGWSLDHRLIVITFAASTLVAGIGLFTAGHVAVEFVPASDNGYFVISTEAAPGTSLATHDAAIRRVEEILLAMPEVMTVTASVGVSGSGNNAASSARYGTVTVEAHARATRRPLNAIMDDARARLADVPGTRVKVSAPGGGPNGGAQPIAIQLSGPELDTLAELATRVQAELSATRGLINVTNGAPIGQPQLRVDVNQQAAAQLGVSAASIALAVRTSFAGVVATKYQLPDGTLEEVQLQLSSEARGDVTRLGDLPVPTAAGQLIPLRQVVTITETAGPTQISHEARRRIVTVSADLETGQSLGGVSPDLNRIVQDLNPPAGYAARIAGSSAEQAKSFGQLFTALGASVLLAYLLMAVLYNSLLHPLVILFSLPVAVGGAMFGLWIFGYAFSIFAMIGLILLVALAIKNGILLVDRTNRNKEQGMSTHDALLEAGPARLRPIVMTSMTIVVAMLPTALQLGEGAELRAPLAAVVLGGVISSTLLTLVLIPVVYTLLDGLPRPVTWVLQLMGLRGGGSTVEASLTTAAAVEHPDD